jgi:hypothetical protein
MVISPFAAKDSVKAAHAVALTRDHPRPPTIDEEFQERATRLARLPEKFTLATLPTFLKDGPPATGEDMNVDIG